MSLRFAASRRGNVPVLARMLARGRLRLGANDNGRPIGDLMADPEVMRETLLHFARHGLAAADHARGLAEAAFLQGDDDLFRHWLVICRNLDRRLATRLEGRVL